MPCAVTMPQPVCLNPGSIPIMRIDCVMKITLRGLCRQWQTCPQVVQNNSCTCIQFKIAEIASFPYRKSKSYKPNLLMVIKGAAIPATRVTQTGQSPAVEIDVHVRNRQPGCRNLRCRYSCSLDPGPVKPTGASSADVAGPCRLSKIAWHLAQTCTSVC